MKLDVAATKTNLFKMKKLLSLTEEGYQLLDEKRKILMNELTATMHALDGIQKDVYTRIEEAYGRLEKTLVVTGTDRLESLSFAVPEERTVAVSQRRVMGVGVPVAADQATDRSPYFSPFGVDTSVEETMHAFRELLTPIVEMAEKRAILFKLARELQKTMRKVNALEQIHIPYYRMTCKGISDRLDEEGREAFTLLKVTKEHLEKRR